MFYRRINIKPEYIFSSFRVISLFNNYSLLNHPLCNKPNKSGELNVLKHALRKLNIENTNINHLEGLMKHELRSYLPSIAEFDPEHNEKYLHPGNTWQLTLLSLMKKNANIDE